MGKDSFKIKILAYDYEVVSVDPSDLFDGVRMPYSRTDYFRNEIEVAYDNSVQDLQYNLTKEVLKIILDQLGYEELVDNEPFLRSFAMSFTQVLKDNEDFRELFITKEVE